MNSKLAKIEKLKSDIYKCQLEKLGELNTENLKSLGYTNTDYIMELELLEQQKALNDEYIDAYNKKKKEFTNAHNTESIIDALNETHNNNLSTLRDNYQETYSILQEELRTLEYKRNSNMDLNDNYKITIDMKNGEIYKKEQFKLLLNIKIDELQKQYSELNNECEEELKKITEKYDKKIDSYLCENMENENMENNDILVGGDSAEYSKQCREKGYSKTINLFLDKYIIYLTDFHNLCKVYDNSSNITKSCIRFMDEQVKNKIEELKEINTGFNKDNYIFNSEELLSTHNNSIKKVEDNNKKIIKNTKNFHKLELNSIRSLIKYYKELKPLNTREENLKIIDDLERKILNLNDEIVELQEKYLELNRNIKSHVLDCNKKMNNLMITKIELLEKKRKCENN